MPFWPLWIANPAKPLYDVLHGKSIDGVDKRTGLEVLVCRDILTTLQGAVRWIPHEHNISDSLMKIGAHQLLSACAQNMLS
eukprot:6476910-Amphidinium_carterae.1